MSPGKHLPDTRRELLNWIKSKLKEYNIKLRKRLSQIMLVDPEILTFIAKKSEEFTLGKEYPIIIEIGAGIGNLTQFLGNENINALIIAIEIDHRFTPILQEIKKIYDNIEIIIGDAVSLLTSMRGIDLVTGNIPYHITSRLLLALAQNNIPLALLTLQKDVAERIISKPGTKNYGKLSILMQMLFDVEILRIIPSSLFIPPPQVSSAIIILRRKKQYNQYIKIVEELTKCLFSYKRKLVYKAFTYCIDKKLDDKVEAEGDLWKKRVAHLTVEDIVKLTNIYVELKKKN